MLQVEHSAILSTFIKLPFFIKIFVLSIFELPLKTGFTVQVYLFSGAEEVYEEDEFMINLAIIGQVFSFLVQSVVCTEKFHKEVI